MTGPDIISIRIPFRARKRGGRKLMLSTDGTTEPHRRIDSTLVKALACAFR